MFALIYSCQCFPSLSEKKKKLWTSHTSYSKKRKCVYLTQKRTLNQLFTKICESYTFLCCFVIGILESVLFLAHQISSSLVPWICSSLGISEYLSSFLGRVSDNFARIHSVIAAKNPSEEITPKTPPKIIPKVFAKVILSIHPTVSPRTY